MEISEHQKDDTSICCCEYISKQGERYHILSLICNLEKLTRFSEANNHKEVLLQIQQNMRFNWHGTIIEISLEKHGPIFIIPIIFSLAALHLYMAIILLPILLIFLYYVYGFLRPVLLHSKFYFMWTFWSVIYMIVLYELNMPMLSILPEEGYLLLILMGITFGFLWKVKKYSIQNYKSNCILPYFTNDLPSSPVLQIFKEQCYHHSYWLDCCIDEFNCDYYLAGLFFAALSLLFGVYLTLTAVCVPRLIVRYYKRLSIMMPNDCSAVFDEYHSGILFSIAVYALMMAVYISFTFICQGFKYGKRKVVKK